MGTPGVGKSTLFYYLLVELLHLPQPPPFIVWELVGDPDDTYCYNHETGEVRVGPRSSFRFELGNSRTWYFADGVGPRCSSRARIVQITSPQWKTYKGMVRMNAVMLYMPLWSLDELLDCHRKMYRNVPKGLVTELHMHYGGVARNVLDLHSRATLDRQLIKLRQAVDACNIEQIKSTIGAIDMAPEASHQLVHIEVNDDLQVDHLQFASQWVAEECAKKAYKEDRMGLASLLDSTSGSFRSALYEATMHTILSKGGTFTVAPVSQDNFERGEEEVLQLPRCKETEFFKDKRAVASDAWMEGVYYRPTSPTFAFLDSFQCVGDTVNLFQMTIGTNKPYSIDDLKNALQKLRLEDKTPHLFIVVPPDIYGNFKLTGACATAQLSRRKQGLKARTKLYVMKGVYARLRVQQVRAPLTQQGGRRPMAAGFRGGLGR